VKGEGGGECTWLKYFIHIHENRTIKSVEIVLRRGEFDF
jgi:hypothetical protein